MAVNFTKNQDQIITAWRNVADSKEVQNWALFGYEGNTNNIYLMSNGSSGLEGLVQEFNCSLIQYAFCRVIVKELAINKLILINWQGDSSPLSRKGLCASHVGDVVDYFKGCSQTITIRNEDEATKEYLMEQLMKSSSSRVSLPKHQLNTADSGDSGPNAANRSSSFRAEIGSEISAHRKSFWQKQEEEEKERLLEEKKRAAEKQAQFEKERKLREESEAKKLAETIKERDRLIEATRQADRRASSGSSQPNSILSTTNPNDDNDDERVGRRSELIRLERNQETLSLIGKGLIKNKRAIFEQASQQQQQQPSLNTIARRSSGIMVAQRLNSFKTQDSNASSNSSTSVEKLTNGFSKQVNLNGSTNSTVEKEVETIKITPEESFVSSSVESSRVSQDEKKADETPVGVVNNTQPIVKEREVIVESPEPSVDSTTQSNNHTAVNKNQKQELEDENFNDKFGIKARALFDYEAVDNSEISFDPDDLIGFIEKVDKGWWYGSVVTGRFKGQSGLFPSNYVEEL